MTRYLLSTIKRILSFFTDCIRCIFGIFSLGEIRSKTSSESGFTQIHAIGSIPFLYCRGYVTCLILTLCGSLFSIGHLHAGSFRSLGIKEGLSSRRVFQIEKDSAGFIWAYTHMGIDRYDGTEIRHYKLEETIDSRDYLQASTVMLCDRFGNIWVALKNGKIYVYSRETDSFRLRIDLSDYLPGKVLHNVLFDTDNRFWLCTSDGVYCWEEGRKMFFSALKGKNVHCIIQAGNELFFAGTDKGVYQLTRQTGKMVLHEETVHLPMEISVEALFSYGSKLFVGTFSNGVFTVDRLSGRVHSFDNQIPLVPIRSFAKSEDGILLIGADGAGFFCMDIRAEKLLNHYMADEDDENSLCGNTVSDICADEYGNIWVSTSTNGISYLNPDLPHIRNFIHERNNPNSLRSDHVNVLLQDMEGDFWYGTNNGISRYCPQQNRWTHYLEGMGHDAKVVLALAEDSNGNIWAGGYGMGAYCIHKRTGKMKKIEKRQANSDKGIATDYIYAIYADGNELWFGGIEGELTRYNQKKDSYVYYPIDCIGDIKQGKDGSLLIAGCEGLAFLDKQTGHMQWYNTFGGIRLRYPVRCLLQSSSGDIWLATDGEGLVRFNPERKESHVYNMGNGLSSNSINSLLEDNDGRIWFSTEKELYCFDLSKYVIINANDYLDISLGYYNPNAVLKQKDGHLAFGTAEGVISFSPLLDFGQYAPVTLILTDFKLPYEPVKAGIKGSLLEKNINDTQRISLKYNQNSFSISFSIINFVFPGRVRFEYILENYDRQWTPSGVEKNINYMNLSPGKYLFRLRAFDKYTGEKIDERSLEIVVAFPYWLSWWAMMLYFLVFSVFVYMILLYRKHRFYESKIKEKIRSFISIAHDIRTPVTLIKAPLSELEKQETLSDESRKAIAIAMRNVEKLLSMTTQLLDLRKTEQHAAKLEVALCDVKTYMEEKMEGLHLAAMQKNIELRLEVDKDMPRVWIDKKKMDHIVDNLLSNALKYTEKGVIYVGVKFGKKRWTIEVTDTGIGIPKKDQRSVFNEFYRAQNAMNHEEIGTGIGLMITRRLVRQHYGNISFSSEEGKGTTFMVTFPRKMKSGVTVEVGEDSLLTPVRMESTVDMVENTGKNVLLLAEDDLDMREYLTNSLSSEYKVVAVPDGGKALELAREINPDIIISDIVMPVLEGDELCRILKSSIDTSHIPIILLTALSERENIIFGLEAGATDYIIKPFDLSVLKVRIRNILQNRQHLRDRVLSLDAKPEEVDYASQLDKDFLDKVMHVVDEELSNSEFSINDFCRMIGMSRTSVYNKIKTLTGQGPNDFIRIMRLNKAKELLECRKYSIGEVSAMVGFSDPKYFSTCFKKQFGISPSKI